MIWQITDYTSCDTETTGLDIQHGCKPYMVTTCNSEGTIYWWEWPVDPFTREPIIPKEDVEELQDFFNSQEKIFFHNAKFDIRALSSIGIRWTKNLWRRTHDTSIAAHAYRNLWKHGLNYLCETLFAIPTGDEELLHEICVKARKVGKSLGMRIAKKGDPHFPAMQASLAGWKGDTWLPRAILEHQNLWEDEEYKSWHDAASIYGRRDAVRTTVLADFILYGLSEEEHSSDGSNLLDQYETRRKLLRITYDMQSRGIHIHKNKLEGELASYKETVSTEFNLAVSETQRFKVPLENPGSGEQVGQILHSIATKTKVKKGSSYRWEFTFEDGYGYDLPLTDRTETGLPVVDDKRLKAYWKSLTETKNDLETEIRELTKKEQKTKLPSLLKQRKFLISCRRFLKHIRTGRSLDKNLSYLQSYLNWSIGSYIYPVINITGTRFTRQSSSWPNLQQIPKGKKTAFKPRKVFGPERDRIWYDYDYSNLELRLWAYSCNSAELLSYFERGIPVHLAICKELHPHLMDLDDKSIQETIEYGKTKNGNFATIYGALPNTIDDTYGVPGASALLAERFPEIRSFTESMHSQVRERGYIETYGGYRLYIPYDEPHKAVSGYIQGSAGVIMTYAMINCYNYLEKYNLRRHPREHIYFPMQVHDALVFSLPKDADPDYQIARDLKEAMEQGGSVLDLNTPVNCDIVKRTWDVSESIDEYLVSA